jgi:ketosteroid isomerase-like protein
MKKFSRLIGFALIIGFVVMGCSNGSPTNVVKQYYAALAKGDAKTLGKVMTPKGAANLTQFLSKAKDHVTALGKITNTEETIDGDTGTVKVTFSNGDTEEIDVIKIDGKWKVSEWESF